MLLAELDVFHSRPIAPTRRVAIGRRLLPCDPTPGFGGLLIGSICARFAPEVPTELLPDVLALTRELEQGRRIPQPRLRYRFQRDRVGLTRSVQRLFGEGEELRLSFDGTRATPGQLVLGAVYAAGSVPLASRAGVLRTARLGLAWRGDFGPALFAHLSGRRSASLSARALQDPVGWALEVLGFDRAAKAPARKAVQRGFRDALRDAHPDHGGAEASAASRIADLTEARRILLAS